jgi:hypothetical protein
MTLSNTKSFTRKFILATIAAAGFSGAALGQEWPGMRENPNASFLIGGEVSLQCFIQTTCGHNDRCTSLDLTESQSDAETADVSLVCNGSGETRSVRFESANGSKMVGENTSDEIPYLARVEEGGSAQTLPLLVDDWTVDGTVTKTFRITTNLNPYNPLADIYRDTISVTILP